MSLNVYMREANKYRVLDKAEELDLARRYRAGDKKAGQSLICANLRYAVRMAHKYKRYGADLDELVQEANEGMMIALGKFDPDRGFKFVTYATWWINARLRRFTANGGSIVSFGSQHISARVDKGMRRLRSEGATQEEALELLSEEFGMELTRIRDISMRRNADVSMQSRIDHGDPASTTVQDTTAADSVPHDEAMIEEETVSEVGRILRQSIRNLRESILVDRRMLAEEPETLEKVGRRFGVSRERTRQMEHAIKNRVRDSLKSAGLAPVTRVAK